MTNKPEIRVSVEAGNGVTVFKWNTGDETVKVEVKGKEVVELTMEEFWGFSSVHWQMGRQLNAQGIYDGRKEK